MKFREIAAHLRLKAAAYPTEIDYGDSVTVCEFAFGSLRIRCLAYQEAILKVAAKYEFGIHAGKNTRKPQKADLRRPPDADARLTALMAECGEEVPTE